MRAAWQRMVGVEMGNYLWDQPESLPPLERLYEYCSNKGRREPFPREVQPALRMMNDTRRKLVAFGLVRSKTDEELLALARAAYTIMRHYRLQAAAESR